MSDTTTITVRGRNMSEPNGRSADDWFHDYCEANQRARQAEARAEKAEADAKEWKEQIPEECPITGLPYFNSFKNSAGVYQPFYGGPCDAYGIPYKDEDGYLCRKHLCLDSMREEDENMCLQVVEEERMIDLGEAEAKVARLLAERDWLVERCAELCEDDEHYPDSRKQRVAIWKEAARRAVADEQSEGTNAN